MVRLTVFAVVMLVVATGCCLGQRGVPPREIPNPQPPRTCSNCYCNRKIARCQPNKPFPWEDVDQLAVDVALRSPEQIQEEDLPEGCLLDTQARDEDVAAKVTCPAFPQPSIPWMSNGDCCCEAKRLMFCPLWIQCGNEMVKIVQGVFGMPFGPKYQCWPIIECGAPGQCKSRNCQPITENRPVLIETLTGKWGWRMCPQQTGCKCVGENGQPCQHALPAA